jgi:tRNA (cytidine/uridine-2'-O-)-methyltransferase
MSRLHVVLVEPEIPQNTGNIARTCAATGARLHLVKPLGFFMRDRHLRRAGVDYWDEAEVITHDDLAAFLEECRGQSLAYFSRKAVRTYDQLEWPADADLFLVFGRESTGLPDGLLEANPGRSFRIPMTAGVRSLNLAGAAAVVVYDLLRRRGFPGLG